MEQLTTIFNVLLIVLGFGLLIAVHELGHFIAAKWAGIRTEAFAIGMGPTVFSWRKGIGSRFGSTQSAYLRRVDAYLKDQSHSSPPEQITEDQLRKIGDKLGLGETEYSLRLLPIGGFVKMLGQEDANPNAVSNDPRSYTRCTIGKRMIVVSAGVIMNILLALVTFVIAFMAGVRFEAPVVGEVVASLPAGRTMPDNAKELGIETPGLQPGDEVVAIDGDAATTFADLQIASAMSRPGKPVHFAVKRAGYEPNLQFTFQPERDPVSGLRGIGIQPGASSTLDARDEDGYTKLILKRTGLQDVGIQPGMRLTTINDQPITTYGQLTRAAADSNGQPLATQWQAVDADGNETGTPIHANLPTRPLYSQYLQKDSTGDDGLFGLSPLTRVVNVEESSQNHGILQPNDIIVQVGDVEFPRRSQLFETLTAHKDETLRVDVLRNGLRTSVECKINRRGQLQIEIAPANDTLISAQPILTHMRYRAGDPSQIEEVRTPIASLESKAIGGMHVLAVNGEPVESWPVLREALRLATATNRPVETAALQLRIASPAPGSEPENIQLPLTGSDITELHALKWTTDLSSGIFESIQTTRTAHGNPLTAIAMGFAETKKLVLMTYLTIDRLFRGTVGVDQLRGPVGIVHIGSKVADRGFMYIIFFLGMISVNLAVINFLPMPIVDGGLFLFLIYEKFKGRPPSLAFQNAATIVGLCLIGTLFIVTFYNDVLRLIG